MSWIPADPKGTPSGRPPACMPTVFSLNEKAWGDVFGATIDDTSSEPNVLEFLAGLLALMEPKVIVEVGTYRGWGTVTFAETLRCRRMDGHVWSCDPVDYGVQELVDRATLADRITLVHGPFEDLLPILPGSIDFCYVDASDADDAQLRLRYTKLALKHLSPNGLIVVDDAGGDWKGAGLLRRTADFFLPYGRGLAFFRG